MGVEYPFFKACHIEMAFASGSEIKNEVGYF
jgi:hypothetical protein